MRAHCEGPAVTAGPSRASFGYPWVGYPLVMVKFSTPQAEVVPALSESPL